MHTPQKLAIINSLRGASRPTSLLSIICPVVDSAVHSAGKRATVTNSLSENAFMLLTLEISRRKLCANRELDHPLSISLYLYIYSGRPGSPSSKVSRTRRPGAIPRTIDSGNRSCGSSTTSRQRLADLDRAVFTSFARCPAASIVYAQRGMAASPEQPLLGAPACLRSRGRRVTAT